MIKSDKSPRDHCDQFCNFLREKGIQDNVHDIVLAVAKKVNAAIPGVYDETLYEPITHGGWEEKEILHPHLSTEVPVPLHDASTSKTDVKTSTRTRKAKAPAEPRGKKKQMAVDSTEGVVPMEGAEKQGWNALISSGTIRLLMLLFVRYLFVLAL